MTSKAPHNWLMARIFIAAISLHLRQLLWGSGAPDSLIVDVLPPATWSWNKFGDLS